MPPARSYANHTIKAVTVISGFRYTLNPSITDGFNYLADRIFGHSHGMASNGNGSSNFNAVFA